MDVRSHRRTARLGLGKGQMAGKGWAVGGEVAGVVTSGPSGG
jgi:hypothetical protein